MLRARSNEGARTVEAELELALYLAGVVSKDNFGNLRKVSWTRSGRTDKGVHAAAQASEAIRQLLCFHVVFLFISLVKYTLILASTFIPSGACAVRVEIMAVVAPETCRKVAVHLLRLSGCERRA